MYYFVVNNKIYLQKSCTKHVVVCMAFCVYIKKIKRQSTTFPKLYYPLPDDKLIKETDASDEFWGGILKAKNDNSED